MVNEVEVRPRCGMTVKFALVPANLQVKVYLINSEDVSSKVCTLSTMLEGYLHALISYHCCTTRSRDG